MSVDLDRIFEGMAQEADRAVLPPVEAIHRRARRRSGISVARLVSLVSIVAALTFTTYATVGTRPDPTPEPTGSPGQFLPFDADAPPVIGFEAKPGLPRTITRGDVSYAGWVEGGAPRFAAVDLRTRRALWGPLRLDEIVSFSEMRVSGGAILILASTRASNRFVALDPADGRVMWHRDTPKLPSVSFLLYDDVAILGLASAGRAEAVQLRTGGTIWSAGWVPKWRGFTMVRTFDELLESGGYESLTVPADRRFVMHSPGNRIQLRDAATGEVSGEYPDRTDGLTTRDLVIDGKLYLAGQGGVTVFDLETPGAPTKIHNSDTTMVTPCGPVLICVVERALFAIDPATKQQLWERPVYGLATPFPGRNAILVPSVDTYTGYDLAGKQLLTVRGPTHWVDDRHLLAQEADGISAYDLTGKRTLLGKLPVDVRCSWNSTMLTCLTDQGIKVWRYRA